MNDAFFLSPRGDGISSLKITSYDSTIFKVFLSYIKYAFVVCEYPRKMQWYVSSSLVVGLVDLTVLHRDPNTLKYSNEGFLPLSISNGVLLMVFLINTLFSMKEAVSMA